MADQQTEFPDIVTPGAEPEGPAEPSIAPVPQPSAAEVSPAPKPAQTATSGKPELPDLTARRTKYEVKGSLGGAVTSWLPVKGKTEAEVVQAYCAMRHWKAEPTQTAGQYQITGTVEDPLPREVEGTLLVRKAESTPA